ncbi:hypothetical protein D3C72_1362780 [compost metagenome]
MVQCNQYRRGIGRAASQTAAHRQVFLNMDIGTAPRRKPSRAGRRVHQQPRGTHDQIIFMSDAVNGRQQVNLAVVAQFDGDRVAIIDKLKQRLQHVVAVSALPGDVQKQVQLRRRGPLAHHLTIQLSILSLIRWLPSVSSILDGNAG